MSSPIDPNRGNWSAAPGASSGIWAIVAIVLAVLAFVFAAVFFALLSEQDEPATPTPSAVARDVVRS